MTIVDARGALAFRREAWLTGRAAGLEVHGYRPTQRDLQALEKRTRAGERRHVPEPRPNAAEDRFAVVETAARARISDKAAQDRLMARAWDRFARWLDRGAKSEPLGRTERATPAPPPRERRRGR